MNHIWPSGPADHRRHHGPAGPPGCSLATSRCGIAFIPPSGRGIQVIPEGIPLGCWLPLKPGLTPHGLRHSHKTWMAEDGIPEILAEQRLGHEVPGMRGLYAHASDRMRDDLKAALQARWLDSLRARAAIAPHSPVPLLDELLAPIWAQSQRQTRAPAKQMTPSVIRKDPPKPGDREKMISQIPPRTAEDPTPGTGRGSSQRASDLAKHQNQRVELRGFEPLTPSMRTMWRLVHTRSEMNAAPFPFPVQGLLALSLIRGQLGPDHAVGALEPYSQGEVTDPPAR
jgi:hypothetical protein